MSVAALVLAAPVDDGRKLGGEPTLVAPAAPVRSAQNPRLAPQSEGRIELERWSRQTGATQAPKADVVNAFSSTSWYVPPPPPKLEPPPKPTAPPVPFTFMGRYEDASRSAVVVMLIKGDRLYTVSASDVIEDTYRVERIIDKTIELTYLPLNAKQSLPIGGE
jgi:hypothetical protein